MKRALIWIVAALAIIGIIVWRFVDKAKMDAQVKSGPGGGGKQSPLVDAMVVGPATITEVIDTVCSLESPYKVQLSPTVAGQLKSILVHEGDRVRIGQVLATIDPADAQANLAQAQANAAQARARFSQAKLVENPTNVAVRSQIEQGQASVTSSEANAAQVKQSTLAQIASSHSSVVDAQAKIQAALSQVANAEAVVARELATLNNLRIRLGRVTELYNQRFVAAQDVDDAKSAVTVQENAVKVARAQLDLAQHAVDSARAIVEVALDNEKIARGKAKADIVAANAQVTQVRAQLKTASSNLAQSPAYRANLAALLAATTAADALVAQARTRLANTQLKSTVDGTVTARSLEAGALASPGSPVLTVQSLDWLYAAGSVAIESSAALNIGQQASVILDDVAGDPITGKIIQINEAADPTSRQFAVRVRVENRDHRLHPGMFGRMKIVIRSTSAAVAVPKEVITTTADGTTVAILDKELKVKVQKVELGVTDNVVVEIKSGLNPGDRIVSRTYDTLKDGQTVKLPESKDSKGRGKGSGRPSGGTP